MKGYYKNVKAAAHCLGADGWLRTGDIGHYDSDGYVYVVDRLRSSSSTKDSRYIALIKGVKCFFYSFWNSGLFKILCRLCVSVAITVFT